MMLRLSIRPQVLLLSIILLSSLYCGTDIEEAAEKKWDEREDSLSVINEYKKFNQNKFFRISTAQKKISDSADSAEMKRSGELLSAAEFYEFKLSALDHRSETDRLDISCISCHSRESSVQGFDDFYIPGRDTNDSLRKFGFLLIIGSALAVVIHGSIRIIFYFKKGKS